MVGSRPRRRTQRVASRSQGRVKDIRNLYVGIVLHPLALVRPLLLWRAGDGYLQFGTHILDCPHKAGGHGGGGHAAVHYRRVGLGLLHLIGNVFARLKAAELNIKPQIFP